MPLILQREIFHLYSRAIWIRNGSFLHNSYNSYIVDIPATIINVTGDTVTSMMVTRNLEGKGWMNRILK